MRCAIALGSNVGDRFSHLQEGKERVVLLHFGPGVPLVSPVYETEPVDCAPGTEPYLNAVVEIETDLEPLALLRELQAIERSEGRPALHGHNAPRTLDLDLLYAGGITLRTDALTLPHPRMASRRFVLQPLADIRPEGVLPGFSQTIAGLLAGLPEKPAVYAVSSLTL